MTPAHLVSEVEALDIHLSLNGDKLHIDAPTGVLTPELLHYLTERKTDLLTWLDPDIPQSFKDSPCRCGEYHAVKTVAQGWVSPCYLALLEESKKARPSPAIMDVSETSRGLPKHCCQCMGEPVYFGTGCTPYCKQHLPASAILLVTKYAKVKRGVDENG